MGLGVIGAVSGPLTMLMDRSVPQEAASECLQKASRCSNISSPVAQRQRRPPRLFAESLNPPEGAWQVAI